jgi:hypothetical protein
MSMTTLLVIIAVVFLLGGRLGILSLALTTQQGLTF